MKLDALELNDLKKLSKIISKFYIKYPVRFLYLNGDLGTGKTTFSKFFCENFGVDPDLVSSPTFSIVNIYEGYKTIYHVDLYRLESPDELFYVLEENFEDEDGIFLIEWSNLFENYFTEKGITLNIFHRNDGKRNVEIIIDAEFSSLDLIEDLRRWQHDREKVRKIGKESSKIE
ncbi:tRNA threonylcarbamoyladenosine biosynthesis protein TsaE [Thermosipho japonicus]|uniref:tRNA threonylcarbamoyladenosine biosynthesis protein TsaE n=1 Tax=Thermosipho japonicus TaxID=90323 RepID=A0A841GPZ3_9BACT|nr:tRNA (adenosine(37)-N6)-threonylcarbamoyltransferase complex ATPase subunit type 1 TsaE [Thermosipho japonicus]MBB6061639.1 tRNA threonylcarbamoyladenosine biosynthesis protein TsaE [Thermosipho japonicus]